MSDIVVLQSGLPFTVYTSASFNPILDADCNVIGLNPGAGISTPTDMATMFPTGPRTAW